MSENTLASLDAAFARPAAKLDSHTSAVVLPFGSDRHDSQEALAEPFVPRGNQTAVAAPRIPGHTRSLRDRWPWLEIYFVIQFAWGAVLFLPGAQTYRPIIRALPYASSVALLALYLPAAMATRYPRGSRWLLAALALLAANLLHPTTQPLAGMAQWIFQLAIAAPIFWTCKALRSRSQITRVFLVILVLNAASAGLGILQVYFPEQFMPRQFSSLGMQLNDAYVDSQTYRGRDGRWVVRPPGLSDQPGGAAIAGSLAALLGLALSVRARTAGRLIGAMVSVALGLTVIYLTQIRSVLLMVIGAAALLCLLFLRQRRFAAAGWIAGTGGALVVAGFLWAASVGGESVEQRFLGITEVGAVRTYQENRGHFLAYTVGELLDQFPLGAGVGRWGMMNTYLGDTTNVRAEPIYVEIQLTGWLLDGGVPMWILYGGAILLSLVGTFGLTRRGTDPDVVHYASLALAIQVLIVGMAMAGPAFNSQLGMLFWGCAAAVHGLAIVARDEGSSQEAA
jgi:hypothetical protein